MRLRDVAVRNAKARSKAYKLSDGNGLQLLVHPQGGKYWQFRFKMDGKEKTLSLGAYPLVSLQEARDARDDAKRNLRSGSDPADEKKRAKSLARAERDNAFKSVATEWLEKRKPIWTEKHWKKVEKRLEADIYPVFAGTPIAKITPKEMLDALQKIEEREAIYTAHRTQQIVGQIFRFAVASGKTERDITADLRGALQPAVKTHYARLQADELPEFLQKLRVFDGDLQTQNALRLLLLTFVRTGELRGATWDEFNLEKAEWRIPATRMKMRIEHIVPLSRQAVEVMESQKLISGNHEHVFPSRTRPRSPISENTVLFAIYRMGFHTRTTAHGFRGTASTTLHENGFASEFIERQLAHGDKNTVRASYNHAGYLAQRREMMQWWADYLDAAEKEPKKRKKPEARSKPGGLKLNYSQ